MSKATTATYERWAAERAGRRQAAEEIAAGLEAMPPLWMANSPNVGDGIDQKAAVEMVRRIGGIESNEKPRGGVDCPSCFRLRNASPGRACSLPYVHTAPPALSTSAEAEK